MREQEKLEKEKIEKKITYKRLKTYLFLTFLFFLLSLLSIYIIYRMLGEADFDIYRLLKTKIVIPTFVCFLLYYFFDGIRVYYILRSLNTKVSLKLIYKLAFLNTFVSNVTPSATGGGFIQIYYLNKSGISIGDATAATTIRTVLTIFFFVVSIPFVLLIEKQLRYIPNHSGIFVYTFLMAFTYVFVIFFSVYKSRLFKKIVYSLLHILKRKKLISPGHFKKLSSVILKEITIYVYSMLDFIRTNPFYMLLSVIFTTLFLFSMFSFTAIIIKGLGYSVPYTAIISYQILVTFIMYFAPTPGSVGIAEGIYSYIFLNFVKPSDVVLLTAGWRFLTVYIGMLIGLLIFYIDVFKGILKFNK